MTGVVGRVLRAVYRRVRRWTAWPPVGTVDFGDLRRVEPISRTWGYHRGGPIDRYYIERFLDDRRSDIQGRVLEMQDSAYAKRFGGNRVTQCDVLDVVPGNRQATIIADLTSAVDVPDELFDAIICTQTLHVIYDIRAALQTLHRVLRPGGVLLATLPGITKISRRSAPGGDHWRLTADSATRLFREVFTSGDVDVRAHGNVLSAVGFLHGLGSGELSPDELQYADPEYEVIIVVRAAKRGAM